MTIKIPVSPGELLDKLSILSIKLDRMDDAVKKTNVRREHRLLENAWNKHEWQRARLDELFTELRKVNEVLWVIEDDIRECERKGDFGARFVELARSVYLRNDQRAAIKKQINETLGSELIEEKSYQQY